MAVTVPIDPANSGPVLRTPTDAGYIAPQYDSATGVTTGNLNVVDPEGDPLTYSYVYPANWGSFAVDTATGDYVYTPENPEPGWDVPPTAESIGLTASDANHSLYFTVDVGTFYPDWYSPL